jgi:hypothetical protein
MKQDVAVVVYAPFESQRVRELQEYEGMPK